MSSDSLLSFARASEDRPVVLVAGDAMVPSTVIANAVRQSLGDSHDILEHNWDVDHDEAVAANRQIEQSGPEIVAVLFPETSSDGRVVAIVTHFTPLSHQMLERYPALRVVATIRSGIENLSVQTLTSRGIPILRNLGRNANAVAEMTIALMLSRLRGIGEAHHRMRLGEWRPEPYTEGYRELAGMRVGLVGLGSVGALVLKRLSGFDVEIVYFDPYATEPPLGARSVTLNELLRTSDIVSLHAKLTDASRCLVGAPEFTLMQRHSILINTARAELVDEVALIDALRSASIAGAGLDVYCVEPLPSDHELRLLHSVSLSPHLAGVTVNARSQAPRLIANRLAEFLAHEGCAPKEQKQQ